MNTEIQAQHDAIYNTPNLPPFNFDQLSPPLFGGRQPLSALDVQQLQSRGVTHVLDLREEHEWNAPNRFGAQAIAEMERLQMTRVHLPVVDMGTPTAQAFEQAAHFIAEAAQNGGAVYVHCRAGMERTAAIVAASAASAEGVSFDEALRKLTVLRPIFNPLPHQVLAARNWVENQQSP